MKKLTYIDLFCGCGGFSLGLDRAGLMGLAAIDSNPEAVTVFKKNFPQIPYILQEDVTAFTPRHLAKMLGDGEVDLIVGGPPCQGFSMIMVSKAISIAVKN